MKCPPKYDALRKGFVAAREVSRLHGIPVWRQVREWVALRRNGVGLEDYYYYRLYDAKLHPTMEEKLTYGGWRAFMGEFRRYANIRHEAIAYEKHIFYRICDGFGLPVPLIYSVYTPSFDAFERHRSITKKDDLRDYLSSTRQLPFFGKPSNASRGFGARGVLGRAPDGRFRLVSGESVTLDVLVNDIERFASDNGTYLITEFLQNDPEIVEMVGEVLCSLRVVMLVRNGEPEFFRTSMHLPGAGSHASNVAGFATGTISCGIDPHTGIIRSALQGAGAERQEVKRHPISSVQLIGYVIPGWELVRTLALEASKAMSPFRMQHWDFALTTRGPVILEMNVIGDVAACQRHGPPGIYTKQYLGFRDTHAYK